MRTRKTVKVPMGANAELNKFKAARLVQYIPRQKHADQCSRDGVDFEKFLWDNVSAEFYNTLREKMNKRVAGDE